MTTRRATISDVARAAGVSPSTASVVFSGKTPVSDATRIKVLEAAHALGYTGPDPRAASLRRGRSGIVAIVFEGPLGSAFLDPVQRLMMDGLSEAVAPLGAGLLLLHDPVEAGEADPSAPTLTTAPIDAAVLIGCSPVLRESLESVRARGIPVVVIEGNAGEGIPQISLDNRVAQSRAAEHLRALGHRNVAIVTLGRDKRREPGWVHGADEITVEVTRDRLAGARDVYPDAPAFAAATSTIDGGMAAGRVVLGDPASRPTAVLAQSDLLAAGVIRAAEELGLRVPEDLSVTGFDGVPVDGLAPYVLTTLVQAATEKGRAAGAVIAAMLDDREPTSLLFTCEFRAGNTTGPVPPR